MGRKQTALSKKKAKKRAKRVGNQLRVLREKQKKEIEKKVPSIAHKYPNGKMIEDMLRDRGVKGHFKDYVIVNGERIIDYKSSYTIRTLDGQDVGTNSLTLMHKRKLKNLVGEEAAGRFWHPILGRITDVPPATEPKTKKKK